MGLDLDKVASQIGEMINSLKAGSAQRREHLKCALDICNQPIDLDALKKKIASSKTTWLVADLVEGLSQHYQTPPTPAEFTIIATDGSHIDIDRHRTTRCYLINIGTVILNYGISPDATLESSPRLYSQEEDLVITSPDGKGREQTIEGPVLGIKRSVEECQRIADLIKELPKDSITLALLDGSLILWGLEAYPDFVAEALLNNGLLRCLDEIKKLSEERKLAIASYISFPRSTDVVNVLRLALCPDEPVDCDRCRSSRKEKECDKVSGVRDRELFMSLLGVGERSALYISPSKIQKRYGEQKIYFFYLRLEDEVARIEIPQWAAQDESRLNLVHALILDQCRRGQGYPVALSEAHEKAVVTTMDRENFWQMVDSSLVEEHMPTLGSAKSQSKRTRWI